MSAHERHHVAAVLALAAVLGYVASRAKAESPAADSPPVVIELPPADKQVDFAADILPLLQRSCLACHSASVAEADVVLETSELLRAARDAGALVTPGDPASSRLLAVAAHRDEPIMPPADNDVGATALTPAELGLLQRWIEQGAKDSRSAEPASINWQSLPDNYRPILATAVAPAGDMAACSRGNEVFVYGLQPGSQQGQVLATLTDPALDPAKVGPCGAAELDVVRAIAIDRSANWMATAGYGSVKLWQREHDSTRFDSSLLSASISAAAADGDHLAIAGEDGAIQLFDLSNNKHVQTWKAHDLPVVGLALVRSGSVLVSVAGNVVKAWQVPNGLLLGSWRLSVPPKRLVMPADDLLVTASDDVLLRVWSFTIPADPPNAASTAEPASLEPQRTLAGHGRVIRALAVLPGAPKQFLSGSVDGTVRQWNAEDGSQIKAWIHGEAVSFIGVQRGGGRFASIGDDREVKVWGLSEPGPIATLEGDFRLHRLANRVAQFVQIAQTNLKDAQNDVETAKKRLTTDEEAKGKAAADLEAAKKVASEKQAALNEVKSKHDSSAKTLAELNEKRTQAESALAEATRRSAESGQDLELLAAAVKLIQKAEEQTAANAALERIRQDRQTYLQSLQRDAQSALDLQTKARDEAQASHDTVVKQVEEAQNAVDVATAANRDAETTLSRTEESIAGSQEVVEAAKDVVTQCSSLLADQEKLLADTSRKVQDQKPSFHLAAFSADGNRLLLTAADGDTFVYDAQSFAPLDAWDSAVSPQALASIGETEFIVAGGASADDAKLIRWNSSPKWILRRTLGMGSIEGAAVVSVRVLSIDFSPDGSLLAAAGGEPSRSGQITIWNVNDGSLARDIHQPHSDAVFSVAFSPDGRHLASASADRTAKVFRTSDGELVRTFEGHTDHVTGVSWRANGKQLVTSSSDHKIKVWSFELGEQQRTIDTGAKEVTGVAFAGTGAMVISSSGDRNIRIHNADDGAAVRTISGAAGYLFCCDTTETGSLVVAGGEDRVLRVWKVDDGTELLKLEARK
jgi:WD40 repeat protein